MEIPSKHLKLAVEQLATLPGVGKRSALRLALSLIQRNEEEINTFTEAIKKLKTALKLCKSCGNISDADLCDICNNPNRDQSTICIVEDIRDVLAIEATQSYKGVYQVLGGVISPMDGIGPDQLNLTSLIEKVKNGKVKEIIFGLSSTMEGDTTNFYIFKKIKDYGVIVTTLSRGVAVGTELQYADEITLSRSIMQRLPFEASFGN